MKNQFGAILFCALVLFVACKRGSDTSGAADRPGGGAFGHSATEQYNDSLNKPGATPMTSNSPPSTANTNQHPAK